MQNIYTSQEMKVICNATVVALEPVYGDSRHRVLLYYENGKSLF